MNKLDELIQSLCPNGVPYVELGTIAKGEKERNKGQEYNLAFSITKGGLVKTSDYFKEATVTSEDTSAYKIVRKNWFVYSPSRIDVGSINYLKDEEVVIVSPLNVVFSISEDRILPQFLLYFLQSRYGTWQILTKREGIEGTGRKLLPFERFSTILVPLPPLEVQREVVKILGVFENLTIELSSELIARKKQYEYYADQIFASNIPKEEWMSIRDIVISLKTGLNPRQNFKLNVGGNRPYITGKDIYNNSINVSNKTDLITDDVVALINRRACLATNDVLFASTGTGTVGRMAVVDNYDDTWAVSETMFCLKPKLEIIHPYYLMYVLYTQSARNQFEPKISKGSVPHLKVKDLLDVKIPVPTLAEQERIVDFVRKFDALCNDLSTGLPAEIETRQKQYAYYRDKLLSFKELSV